MVDRVASLPTTTRPAPTAPRPAAPAPAQAAALGQDRLLTGVKVPVAPPVILAVGAATAPKAPAAPAAPAPPAGRDVVVPGEKWRTLLCFAAMVLNPLVQATQTVGMLAKATFSNAFLQTGAQLVVRGAGALAGNPIVNNPVTRGAMRAAGAALPFVNAAILAFDGYAAWQTFTNPAASPARKWLTGLRLGFNAVATGLSFIPGRGAVLAMAPAWASIGLDLWIKRLNATETAAKK